MTIYYVDATAGLDSNSGLTPELAWQTIAKVNASTFSPGDSILFKRGETWREQLTVPSSGSSGNPITFGAYGTGAKPIISGAELLSSWTQHSGNIYVASSPEIPLMLLNDGALVRRIRNSDGTLSAGQWDYVDSLGSNFIFNGDLETETSSFTTQFDGKTVASGNTLAITTTAGEFNSGTQGAKVTFGGTGVNAYVSVTINPQGEVFCRLQIKFNSSFTFGAINQRMNFIELYDSTVPRRLLRFGVQSSNPATSCRYNCAVFNGSADVSLVSTGTVPKDSWLRLELHWKKGTGANGGAEVKVNGAVIGSSLFSYNLTSFNCDSILVGAILDQASATPTVGSLLYFDDFAVSKTAYPGTDAATPGLTGVAVNVGGDPAAHVIERVTRDYCAHIATKPYITLDNLHLNGAKTHGAYVSNGSPNFTIKNSTVSNVYDRGIFGETPVSGDNSNPLISHNEVYGCGAFGISWCGSTDGGFISHNDVHDNALLTMEETQDSEFEFTAGIDNFGNQINVSNLVVENNAVYNNGRPGQTSENGNGIWNDETLGGNIIRFNTVYGNAGCGIIAENTPGGGKIYGNVIYDNGHDVVGYGFGLFVSRGCAGWDVYNNTLYNNYKGLVVADYNGAWPPGVNTIKNNIVLGSTSRALTAIGGGETTTVFSHNCFGSQATNFIEWGSGAFKSTYSAWGNRLWVYYA